MASGAWTLEELSVSDVFALQTVENVEQTDPCLPHGAGEGPSPRDSGSSSTGFRMTAEVSPTRGCWTGSALGRDDGNSNQPTGATSSKKKRRNKRRQNPAAFPELFPPEYGNNRASTSRSGTPKAPSPLLQPLRGAEKSPAFRPATPNGISALKMQLDALNLTPSEAPSSNASVMGSEAGTSCASVVSDSDQTETYEVHLEHDFVSSEANDGEKGASDGLSKEQKRNILYRKMSAEDFEPLTCLGKGTYGTVLLVRHKITGALYAQKQFRKASLTVHKKLVEQTKTERAILESVNRYPFIVNLYYAFQDHEKLYLILEYAQGGELFTHLAMERMFTEDVAAFYMAELVLALEHLHHNIGVIYRDLKPENCLLDTEGHLLLTDFGLSKVSVNGEDRCNSSLGTIEYMAPEVIQGKPYGKACDWWSLGALGFDLLTGSPPFKGNNNAKISEKIIKQKLVLPYFLGPDAKDLLTRLLRKEPHKRLGYNMPKDIRTIKGHRFFRKIDWKALERRELDPPIKPVVTDPALAENFSADFTTLPLSPVVTSKGSFRDRMNKGEEGFGACSPTRPRPMEMDAGFQDDPFGGFSFVAPSSLLDIEFNYGAGRLA
ncbi:protein kinase, putative [Coccidioides posadasii C735 delta SOWgp]|uniref:Protein kinase, putative n=1 Tax=Coccidioides posadasii (strain C735) TaxID=222929 RepID=C5P9W1_COCP7|nr:protein kinase, putative [Coccidioides posadasii C735 delta SOWgp]EER26523.1 protein kinase, putative [Coccidioides posadasii C735 delta SOWgp]|eukprot:XP_003068668.1 protein kinase, putative [Coccidioides posadasii C735 delta SOWgp]